MVPRHLMDIVREAKTIAVVGVSPKRGRANLRIYRFLKERGYRVFPVNPNYGEINGDVTYLTLLCIEEDVDVADIFRNREKVVPIVEDATKKGLSLSGCKKGLSMTRRPAWPVKLGFLWSWTGVSTKSSWPFD